MGPTNAHLIASVEAARRRRRAGRRRRCEGMCFSLPTIDDPFNDKSHSKWCKSEVKRMQEEGKPTSVDNTGFKHLQSQGIDEGKRIIRSKNMNHVKKGGYERIAPKFDTAPDFFTEHTSRPEDMVKAEDGHPIMLETVENDELQQRFKKDSSIMSQRENPNGCVRAKSDLNVIQNGTCQQEHSDNIDRVKWMPSITVSSVNIHGNISAENIFMSSLHVLLDARLPDSLVGKRLARGKPESNEISKKVASRWDWQFWEACGTGLDILATCGTSGLIRSPAYVVAAAAHISHRRLQNKSYHNPLVLLLLASQGQTLKVRQICRPLKTTLNVRSVSLHPGTPLHRQIEGLSMKLPEILVTTPDQLCKLLALRALCISNVSFMVVDDLAETVSAGFSNELGEIRMLVHPSVQTAILSSSFSDSVTMLCRRLIRDPIFRVTSNRSVAKRSACITQSVFFTLSEVTKMKKFLRIVNQFLTNQKKNGAIVILQQSDVKNLASVLHAEGYSVGCFIDCQDDPLSVTVLQRFRKGELHVLLCKYEVVNQLDLGQVKTVIYYDFPSTIQEYCNVLTSMASFTVNGILYSFCSASMAHLALEFVQLLVHCSQYVPPSLQMLAEAAIVVQQNKLSSN